MKTKLFKSSTTKVGCRKSHFKLIGAFLLVIFLNACQKHEDIGNTHVKSFVKLTESEKLALRSLGYSTDSIAEFKEYYLVEGDILIRKARLKDLSNQKSINEVKQHHTYELVSNYSDYNINILVTQSIWTSSQWYSGLSQAVEYWNSLPNSNIKLHLIGSSYHTSERIDITVASDNGGLPSYVAATAEFPSSGRPGRNIYVNTDFRDPNTNDFYYSQATWNMIHEIGHCLGFRHTNWYLNGESLTSYGAVHIPNTPNQYSGDSNSIMNGGTALSSCNGNCFSNFDQIAVNYLYPVSTSSPVVPHIMGSGSLYGSGQSIYSISYRSGESNINYKWEVIGISGTSYYYQDYESLPVVELPMPGSGNYKVKCTISNGKFSTAIAEKNVVIY